MKVTDTLKKLVSTPERRIALIAIGIILALYLRAKFFSTSGVPSAPTPPSLPTTGSDGTITLQPGPTGTDDGTYVGQPPISTPPTSTPPTSTPTFPTQPIMGAPRFIKVGQDVPANTTIAQIASQFNLSLPQIYALNPWMGHYPGNYVAGGDYNPNLPGNVAGLQVRVA
jgi:hypothetical protein